MSERSARIEPLCAIFCDDIRREDNGKELLIGVYSGGLQVALFPAPVMLSVWVLYERSGVGKIPIEFRLIDNDNVIIGYGKIEPTFSGSDYTVGSLPLRGLTAMLFHACEISFQLRQHEESWITVRKLIIEGKKIQAGPT